MVDVIFKRGTSWEVDGEWIDDEGSPMSLHGAVIRSRMRAPFLEEIQHTVEITDADLGLYRIFAPASQTALWPKGQWQWDIAFDQGELRQSLPETGYISVMIIDGISAGGV